MNCYLFEVKSIQSYLFQSGRLIDIIAASERLDRLVDTSEQSVLFMALEATGLSHDLITENDHAQIHFLRSKGGAFYAYADNQDVLRQLRSSWTLLLTQLFPSLQYADALASGDTLPRALDEGFKSLRAAANHPPAPGRYATAVLAKFPRTGRAAQKASLTSKQAGTADQVRNVAAVDADIEMHRQAYERWTLRSHSELQKKFSPEHGAGAIRPFWLNLDEDTSSKDIAFIHADGNGLGLYLRQLKEALKDASPKQYQSVFLKFSNALAKATQDAAKVATQMLVDSVADNDQPIPMRPILLGGDDVTVLCDARYAIDYAKIFCENFERLSGEYLTVLQHELSANIQPNLSASAGIVFHKVGHPFIQVHQFGEQLTGAAKDFSREKSTINFCRLSQAVSDSYQSFLQRARTYVIDSQGHRVTTSQDGYFTLGDQAQSISALQQVINLAKGNKAIVSLNRWRQMYEAISLKNWDEAERIFKRGIDNAESTGKNSEKALFEKIQHCREVRDGETFHRWYWQDEQGNRVTFISDLLTLAHFSKQG